MTVDTDPVLSQRAADAFGPWSSGERCWELDQGPDHASERAVTSDPETLWLHDGRRSAFEEYATVATEMRLCPTRKQAAQSVLSAQTGRDFPGSPDWDGESLDAAITMCVDESVPNNGGARNPSCHREDPPIILGELATRQPRGSDIPSSFGDNREEITSWETLGVLGDAWPHMRPGSQNHRTTAASETQQPLVRSGISRLEVMETLAAALLTFLKYLVANGWPLVLIWYSGQGLVQKLLTNYTIGQDGLSVTQPLIRCHERALTQAMWASFRPKSSTDTVVPATKCQPNAMVFVFRWQRYIHPEVFCPGCCGELQAGFDLFFDNDHNGSKVLDGEMPPTLYRVNGCPGSCSTLGPGSQTPESCPGGLHVDTESPGVSRKNETLYALHFPEYRLRHDFAQRARLYMLPVHVWLLGVLSIRVFQFCRGHAGARSLCERFAKPWRTKSERESAGESTFAASARRGTGHLEKAFFVLCAYDGRRGEYLAWYLNKFQNSVEYRVSAWVTYMFIVGMLGYGAWDIHTNAANPSVQVLIQEGFLLILAAKELQVPADVHVAVDMDSVAFREATLGWSALLFDAEAAVRQVEKAVLFDSEPRLRRALSQGADRFQPKDFKAREGPEEEGNKILGEDRDPSLVGKLSHTAQV